MKEITIFKNLYTSDSVNVALTEACEMMKVSDNPAIDRLRECTDQMERLELKKRLPVIMWQGKFNGSRKNENLTEFSGLMCLDFDNLDGKDLESLKDKIFDKGHVLCVFLSPSGKGLKVIEYCGPKLNSNNWRLYYLFFKNYYEDNFGLHLDPCSGVLSQGCFLSKDLNILYRTLNNVEEAYVDELDYYRFMSSAIFEKELVALPDLVYSDNDLKAKEIIDKLDNDWSKNDSFYMPGNRTRSIFTQAAKLRAEGISETLALNYLKSKYLSSDYPESKIIEEVHSGYTNSSKLSIPKKMLEDVNDIYDTMFLAMDLYPHGAVFGSIRQFIELGLSDESIKHIMETVVLPDDIWKEVGPITL